MSLQWIFGWQNVVFILPFSVALTYLLVYAFSGVTFGDADGGHDFAHDADGGAANNAHPSSHGPGDVLPGAGYAAAELGSSHGGSALSDPVQGGPAHNLSAHGSSTQTVAQTAGSSSSLATEPGGFRAALTWLGVGRVPLSILLMVLFLSWGVSGFVINQAARDTFSAPWQLASVSLPLAGVLSLLTTRLVVRSIDRWLPLDESTARRRHDLLGLHGLAMFDINDRFGMISLRDDRGELHQVPCRVAEGHPPIAKNQGAVLVSYNARENLYKVVPPGAVESAATPS